MMIEQSFPTLPGCDELCPYSAAGRPEHFPARACIWHAECGCDNGAELSRALRLADDVAKSVICTEGQPLEPGRWKLTSEQTKADWYLFDVVEHLKWRGFAEVIRIEDGLIVAFTKQQSGGS
jgi:hypothetical protein